MTFTQMSQQSTASIVGSAPNCRPSGSDHACLGMRRMGRWKWGVHAHIVLADMTSADQQSFWLAPEREEDQRQSCPSICKLSHIPVINPKLQNILVLILQGFIQCIITFLAVKHKSDSSIAVGHINVSLIGSIWSTKIKKGQRKGNNSLWLDFSLPQLEI